DTLAFVSLRSDRRGVRARLRRIDQVWTGALSAPELAVADRDALAENSRDRAVHHVSWIRAQRRRQPLDGAELDDRRLQGGATPSCRIARRTTGPSPTGGVGPWSQQGARTSRSGEWRGDERFFCFVATWRAARAAQS